MSDQFVAEIRMFGGNFAPTGWALCNGQLMPISQNTALFSLLGTTYGGNGTSNFALPNLQGATPLQAGQGPGLSLYDLGEAGGTETVTLPISQIPAHSHALQADASTATTGTPSQGATALATTGTTSIYGPAQNLMPMGDAIGGFQPHNNRQPYLAVNFIIALQGIFPPRS